jgi:hypothetical protein
MIEPKWVSGDFIPQQLADVLVDENIAGLTESDESDDEFDDVLYSLIDSDFQNFYRIFLIGHVKLLYGNFCPINIVLSEC